MRRIVLTLVVLLAACSPLAAPMTPGAPILQPYLTVTSSPTGAPPDMLIASVEAPLPSPTPSSYAIQPGDTLSQIAEHFRITLDALIEANPGVDPVALRVGDTLHIPASPADLAGEPTPTAVPFPIRQVACHPTADGAVWCFVLAQNDRANPIENITAQVTLYDAGGAAIDSRTALLPLDILPPGASLPLSVMFPGPLPLDVRPQVRILTAMRLLPGDQRYLPAVIQNTLTEVSWQGRTAQAKGEIFLPASSANAQLVWIAAVAYDAEGNVVGWRRWESSAGLPAGSSLPFTLDLASVAGRIARVEFAVEARP